MTYIDKLQGCWDILSIEVEGQSFPPGGVQIVVTGDRFVTLNMGGDYEGTMTATENTFDLFYDKGPHAGKTAFGIYELNGDEWKMCLSLAGMGGRPERFSAEKGSGHALETLVRSSTPAARS